MKIIDVLSDEERLQIRFLLAELLELGDCLVPGVRRLALSKLNKVIVPLSDSHGVLREELVGKDFSWVRFPSIALLFLPEAVLASESWDAARCANPSPGQDSEILTAHHLGSSFCCSHDLRLMFVFLRIFEACTHLCSQPLDKTSVHRIEACLVSCNTGV